MFDLGSRCARRLERRLRSMTIYRRPGPMKCDPRAEMQQLSVNAEADDWRDATDLLGDAIIKAAGGAAIECFPLVAPSGARTHRGRAAMRSIHGVGAFTRLDVLFRVL